MSAPVAFVADPSARPWGLAATFGFGLVFWYTFVLVQAAMLLGVGGLYGVLGIDDDLPMDPHGFTFSLVTCATSALCGALAVSAASLRVGLGLRTYLGLQPVPPGVALRWLLVALLVVAQLDLVNYLVKGEIAPAQWVETYRSAWLVPLFWFALLVAAPVFEEIVFRGFLFAGIQGSRLGGRGAVAITALLWTLLHGHDDPLDLMVTLIFGVVLGIARLRTGSIRVTFAMHALNNLVSLIELAATAGE